MSADLIAEYEAKLATVKRFHPGWRGEDYVAHAEAELAAVKAGGMAGLKSFWERIKNPQPEAAPAGPDWAVLGPQLAEAVRELLEFEPRQKDEAESITWKTVRAILPSA